MRIFVAFLLSHFSAGFLAPPTSSRDRICLRESVADISLEPKEVVKLFGRLAEKYIMLDDSGGRCCYSACSGKCHLDTIFEKLHPTMFCSRSP